MLVKRQLNNREEETNFTLDLLSDVPHNARFQTIHHGGFVDGRFVPGNAGNLLNSALFKVLNIL